MLEPIEQIFINYKNFISKLKTSSTLNYKRFVRWLSKYIQLKSFEQKFKSTHLPVYEPGQIVFLDFGCGLGNEFSYPHYAVVLNTSDRKKNTILTVVPLTSKKERHKELKPWEYELQQSIPSLLGMKALSTFDLNAPEYRNLRDDAVKLAVQELPHEEFYIKYQEILRAGVEAIYNNNLDIMKLREKMKEGSIVETNHVRTINKLRILTPTRRHHALYGVKIHENDLAGIRLLIMKDIITGDIDKLTPKRI